MLRSPLIDVRQMSLATLLLFIASLTSSVQGSYLLWCISYLIGIDIYTVITTLDCNWQTLTDFDNFLRNFNLKRMLHVIIVKLPTLPKSVLTYNIQKQHIYAYNSDGVELLRRATPGFLVERSPNLPYLGWLYRLVCCATYDNNSSRLQTATTSGECVARSGTASDHWRRRRVVTSLDGMHYCEETDLAKTTEHCW